MVQEAVLNRILVDQFQVMHEDAHGRKLAALMMPHQQVFRALGRVARAAHHDEVVAYVLSAFHAREDVVSGQRPADGNGTAAIPAGVVRRGHLADDVLVEIADFHLDSLKPLDHRLPERIALPVVPLLASGKCKPKRLQAAVACIKQICKCLVLVGHVLCSAPDMICLFASLGHPGRKVLLVESGHAFVRRACASPNEIFVRHIFPASERS